MKKKIEIVPYDTNWPKIYEMYAKTIKETLKENCVKIYHVGSTSVPGLCAKPKIDIMCVVKDLHKVTTPLTQIGYTSRGEFSLPLRLFFSKRGPHDINLHVVDENNGELEWNLTFQNYLRSNKAARDLYANTKLNLLKNNPQGFNMIEGFYLEYTVKKGDVIRKISKMAGFNGYRFVIAVDQSELNAYKKLMNIDDINSDNKNTFHLCLYKGVEIVAAACVEFDTTNSTATIKALRALNDKDKKILKDKITQWTEFHSLKLIKLP